MKKIIIIGASSGIGMRVATDFARLGWRVGIAARREEQLKSLKEKYPDQVDIRCRNADGSIVVRLPVEWMKIRPKKKSNLTQEQIEASKARLELARSKRMDSLRQAGDAVGIKEGKS